MSERIDDRGLKAIESALSALTPCGAINRDRVIFAAGQNSARRHRWLWHTATFAASALATFFGTTLWMRPALQVERIVYLPTPATPSIATVNAGYQRTDSGAPSP